MRLLRRLLSLLRHSGTHTRGGCWSVWDSENSGLLFAEDKCCDHESMPPYFDRKSTRTPKASVVGVFVLIAGNPFVRTLFDIVMARHGVPHELQSMTFCDGTPRYGTSWYLIELHGRPRNVMVLHGHPMGVSHGYSRQCHGVPWRMISWHA